MKAAWRSLRPAVIALLVTAANSLADEPAKRPVVRQLTVLPNDVRLLDQRSRAQLLATGEGTDGYQYDLTRDVTFESADSAIADVDRTGVVWPRATGTTNIRAHGFGRVVEIPDAVGDLAKSPPVSFINEVMSVLGKRGCSSGACHGHNSGKGSFKLSLRGYDPAADRKMLLDFAELDAPDQSYLLLKPTTQEPHRGGKRFDIGSDSYRTLRQWVAEAAQADMDRAVPLRRIEILPDSRLMPRLGMAQQLIVLAHFADGTARDVTDQAIYELSGEGVIEVNSNGLVSSA